MLHALLIGRRLLQENYMTCTKSYTTVYFCIFSFNCLQNQMLISFIYTEILTSHVVEYNWLGHDHWA